LTEGWIVRRRTLPQGRRNLPDWLTQCFQFSERSIRISMFYDDFFWAGEWLRVPDGWSAGLSFLAILTIMAMWWIRSSVVTERKGWWEISRWTCDLRSLQNAFANESKSFSLRPDSESVDLQGAALLLRFVNQDGIKPRSQILFLWECLWLVCEHFENDAVFIRSCRSLFSKYWKPWRWLGMRFCYSRTQDMVPIHGQTNKPHQIYCYPISNDNWSYISTLVVNLMIGFRTKICSKFDFFWDRISVQNGNRWKAEIGTSRLIRSEGLMRK
jgi:hypothetical protein